MPSWILRSPAGAHIVPSVSSTTFVLADRGQGEGRTAHVIGVEITVIAVMIPKSEGTGAMTPGT